MQISHYLLFINRMIAFNYYRFLCIISTLQYITKNSDVLGPVDEVGASLASKRNAKLIAAIERQTDGILFYTFDFALDDGTHQLLQLCVNKGKIWSLDANTKEKRYSKRKDMYYNILGSFMPKLA